MKAQTVVLIGVALVGVAGWFVVNRLQEKGRIHDRIAIPAQGVILGLSAFIAGVAWTGDLGAAAVLAVASFVGGLGIGGLTIIFRRQFRELREFLGRGGQK